MLFKLGSPDVYDRILRNKDEDPFVHKGESVHTSVENAFKEKKMLSLRECRVYAVEAGVKDCDPLPHPVEPWHFQRHSAPERDKLMIELPQRVVLMRDARLIGPVNQKGNSVPL